jgi:hypothetical protein
MPAVNQRVHCFTASTAALGQPVVRNTAHKEIKDFMKAIIVNSFPIDYDDLSKLCTFLKKKEIICTIYSSTEFDQYNLDHYVEQIRLHRNTFFAIFDTNIVIDLLRLCKGESISYDDNLSDTKITSCALLILLQCFDIKIEPLFGIHETAQNDDYINGRNNLNLFRAIDNLSPIILNNFLQGKIKSIKDDLDIKNDEYVERLNPYDWYIWFLTYTCVLKIVIIEKTLKDNYLKLKEFINWMWTEFIFCAAPTVFAIIYFSNYKLSKMLKNISSNDYNEIIKIVKNVTWDLSAVEYWIIEAEENHPKGNVYFFCTQDKMLKEISKHILISRTNGAEIENYNLILLLSYWGDTKGEILYKYYNELFVKLNTQEREKRMHDNEDVFANFYKQLEDELKLICKPT